MTISFDCIRVRYCFDQECWGYIRYYCCEEEEKQAEYWTKTCKL